MKMRILSSTFTCCCYSSNPHYVYEVTVHESGGANGKSVVVLTDSELVVSVMQLNRRQARLRAQGFQVD